MPKSMELYSKSTKLCQKYKENKSSIKLPMPKSKELCYKSMKLCQKYKENKRSIKLCQKAKNYAIKA